jgi:hypothetical protein
MILSVPALFIALIGATMTLSSPPAENTITARGTFDVRTTPQPTDSAGGAFMRLFLDKEYHGDLAGTSTGHMLGAETAVKGSAGYVALEKVTGTLMGRSGTFILQHAGHMAAGVMTMKARVIPDSGTEGLVGLAGELTISITGGQHFYSFQYTLEPDHR